MCSGSTGPSHGSIACWCGRTSSVWLSPTSGMPTKPHRCSTSTASMRSSRSGSQSTSSSRNSAYRAAEWSRRNCRCSARPRRGRCRCVSTSRPRTASRRSGVRTSGAARAPSGRSASLGLVGDDDAERRQGLRRQAGERDRERLRAGRTSGSGRRRAARRSWRVGAWLRRSRRRRRSPHRHGDGVTADALDDRGRGPVLRVGKDPHLAAVGLDERRLRDRVRAPGCRP